MPKYIRTEKGIYKAVIKGLDGFDENEKCILVEEKRQYYLLKKDIIAQADTIEELCDEFVYEMGAEHTLVTIGYEQIRDNILTCELLDMSNLYGAVWTDKGLIYVAKMNEDGELVLI